MFFHGHGFYMARWFNMLSYSTSDKTNCNYWGTGRLLGGSIGKLGLSTCSRFFLSGCPRFC